VSIRVGAIVLDAADLERESAFWAGLLGGCVERSEHWHTVRVEGEPMIAIQLSPDHVPPVWPDGVPQQVHLDLEVDDIDLAHQRALQYGARPLRPEAGPDVGAPGGFQVYADPAGHPFCLCWGKAGA
jgi:predicted enzyme related to lactoylglutathione lyase